MKWRRLPPTRGHLLALVLLSACVATAFAQAAVAQALLTVLDGTYTPEQAARGEAVYSNRCLGCHEGQNGDGPQLMGRVFLDRWREDTLEPLFTFIKANMPGDLPGSLDERSYVDVIAYLLQANGLPAGKNELRSDLVGHIQLIGLDGPRPLANLTIVRAVGCLTPEANNTWALEKSGIPRPVHDRIVEGTTPEELKLSAAQPLGTLMFPLLSVTEKGASLAGHRVQVKGVLTRQNTIERINVMSLDSLAPRCAE